jgi:hypothetical protein
VGSRSVTAPLSGIAVTLREPTGAEDLLLADCRADDPALVLRLVERLAHAGADIDWGAQPVFDIDTLIMRLRLLVIGDRVRSHVACTGCGGRVELSFGIATYLAHHRPHEGALRKRGWGASEPDEGGWRRLAGGPGPHPRFRPPTLNDQIAVAGAALHRAASAARPARRPRRDGAGRLCPAARRPAAWPMPGLRRGHRGAVRGAAILPAGARLPRAFRLRRRRRSG